MSATKIDGKAIAADIRTELRTTVDDLKARHPGFSPHLTIIQVGGRDDSSLYVRQKQKAAEEAGISFYHEHLDESISQEELLSRVDALNKDDKVHGVLIQLPLPAHLDETELMEAISPAKDVDGFHPVNIGRLSKHDGKPYHVACTPKGCIELIRRSGITIEGKRAVVVGRSDIVGMPAFCLLTRNNATVTLCHSKTQDLEGIVGTADILLVAIGRPELIQGSWLKPGCTVIDVGMNYVDDATRKSGKRWTGDVHYPSAIEVASHITPVPGGVGPMTVAMLMSNTVEAARRTVESD